MSIPLTVECDFSFNRTKPGRRKEMCNGAESTSPILPLGRVPRISKLMALAIRLDQQVREGLIVNYKAIADVGHVTTARITQILNLVNLAPDIQEEILFLPRTERGRDPIHISLLQPIAQTLEWRTQRKLWKALLIERMHMAGPKP